MTDRQDHEPVSRHTLVQVFWDNVRNNGLGQIPEEVAQDMGFTTDPSDISEFGVDREGEENPDQPEKPNSNPSEAEDVAVSETAARAFEMAKIASGRAALEGEVDVSDPTNPESPLSRGAELARQYFEDPDSFGAEWPSMRIKANSGGQSNGSGPTISEAQRSAAAHVAKARRDRWGH